MTNYCGLISRCKRRRIREFIRPIAMIPLSPPMERTWRDIREGFSRIGPAWELRATGPAQPATEVNHQRIGPSDGSFMIFGVPVTSMPLKGLSVPLLVPPPRPEVAGALTFPPAGGGCRQGCLTAGGARRRCGTRNARGRSRCGHVMGWRAGRLPRRALRRRSRTARDGITGSRSSPRWRRGAGSGRSAGNGGRRHSRAGRRPGWRSSASPRSTTGTCTGCSAPSAAAAPCSTTLGKYERRIADLKANFNVRSSKLSHASALTNER